MWEVDSKPKRAVEQTRCTPRQLTSYSGSPPCGTSTTLLKPYAALDDNHEDHPLLVDPRITPHGGRDEPSALRGDL